MNVLKQLGKFKKLLTPQQWRRLPILFVIMLIGGVMEMLSVSVILPFMDIVMDPDAAMQKWYVRVLCDVFSIDSPTDMLITISITLVVLYIVKNVYIVAQVYIQQRFVGNAQYIVQKKLLETLINRPYEYFMQVSSGDVLTMVYNNVSNTFSLLTQLLTMFSELVIATLLIITVFIITPKVSLIMAVVLSVMLLLIAKGIKPALGAASRQTESTSGSMYKWILQSIQGIKEVKILHSEKYFVKSFEDSGRGYADALRKYRTLNALPISIIEGVTMSVVFTFVTLFIKGGNDLKLLIPTLTAIAMAAVRILPATNRVSTALAQIAYTENWVDGLIEFIEKMPKTENPSYNEQSGECDRNEVFNNTLAFEGITYHYPASEELILEDAEFILHKGESIGIVGASGAGKTTAVDIMLGLLNPQSGAVKVDGKDIKADPEKWISQLGYIPQSIFMLDDNIRSNVAFGIPKDKVNDKEVWRALDEAALGDFVRELPDGLDTEIGERGMRLSGGQRQRIGIARALYRNPAILFFDEATSALDNETEEAIMESIDNLKGNKTMVIIAHRLSTIESCDHIFRVENRKITRER